MKKKILKKINEKFLDRRCRKMRVMEYRALPTLMEKRNDLLNEMDQLVDTAQTEVRAMSEEEANRFEAMKNEVGAIDVTIAADNERRAFDRNSGTVGAALPEKKELEQRAIDSEKFLKFLRGEERALDVANNGGIIPATISNRIIEKVKELSPIYAMATIYNVGGDLIFPVYDESGSSIGASYSEDMTELTEGTGKFTTIKLQSFIVGCLAKVSKSLMNRADFDLISFIVRKVAEAIAEFLEKECLVGTAGKMTGVLCGTNGITSAAATAITADELIDLQDTVPDKLQAKACWIMHKNTRRAIRKLKDADGNYLLNKDLSTPFGYMLMGKPVYVSDNCPKMEAGKKAIAYGDMSALCVKLSQNIDIQILMEKYATQNAVGVVGYVECDSKIVEPQKLAVLTMKAV